SRLVDEDVQGDHERERGADGDDPKQRDADVADVEALEVQLAVADLERVVRARRGSEKQLHRVGEEERDAERADQRRDARRVPKRPVGEALDHDSEDRAAAHGGKRDDRDQRPHRDVRARGATEQLQHAEADERAHHEDVAVGEVEELQDPVDERVPEGDERIDAAERQRVDGELDEGVHRKARWAASSRPPGMSEPSYPTSLYEPFCWIWKM